MTRGGERPRGARRMSPAARLLQRAASEPQRLLRTLVVGEVIGERPQRRLRPQARRPAR